MAHGRQPDYDFFASPQRPRSSAADRPQPAVPADRPEYPGAAPGDGPPAPVPFDHRDPPRIPPGYVPGHGMPSHDGGPDFSRLPGQTRPGRPGWLLGLITAGAGLVLVVVAATVAVPVLRWQHEKVQWRATTIRIPDSFDGQARRSDPVLEATISSTPRDEGFEPYVGGSYGTQARTVVILAARAQVFLDDAAQARVRATFVSRFRGAGRPLGLRQQRAGRLGGWFGCGTLESGTGSTTVCIATDPGAIVAVLVNSGVSDPVGTSRRAREATVRR